MMRAFPTSRGTLKPSKTTADRAFVRRLRRRILARIERDFIPTDGPRWRRRVVGFLAWSVAGPVLLAGGVLMLAVGVMIAVIVGAFIVAPLFDHVDVFTVMWA